MKKLLSIVVFWLVRLCIILLAGTFLFSGFVKAVDPMGMCIKLNAYLAHFDLHFDDNSLLLQFAAIALATTETMLGMNLLLGIRRRLTTLAIAVFMAMMTALTIYIYIANPVVDCGCFGEAIVLSNGETLLKNIVLLTAALFLCISPSRHIRLISERNEWVTSIWTFVYIVSLGLYTLHYLPVVDFTAYPVGADIRAAYNGKIPDRRAMERANFYLQDQTGNDLTATVLEDTSYTFLLTLPDEVTADDGSNDRINDLYDFCVDKGYAFYGVTTERPQAVSDWKDRTGAAYPLLFGLSDQLKAMVRSNPGLLLLKNGRIEAKWSNNELPIADGNISISQLIQEHSKHNGPLLLLLWFIVPLIISIFADRIWIGSKYYRHYNIIKRLKNKAMRKKIVAGNWKMNLNLQEGVALAKELNDALKAEKPNCDVIICTPFIHLASIANFLDQNVVALGAENCADKEKGAYTGEVSAEMVKSTGASYVILGHSERRAYYHETAEILKEKVNLALANGLKVIFCVGEILEEREANRQNDVVKAQLEGSLYDLTPEQFANVVLAYEPVWAIGTGKTATAEQAEEMHAFIRATIAEKFGKTAAEETSILYGGSCKASNAKELFAKPNVDGGLIGGAALKADSFTGIIDAWK